MKVVTLHFVGRNTNGTFTTSLHFKDEVIYEVKAVIEKVVAEYDENPENGKYYLEAEYDGFLPSEEVELEEFIDEI